MGEQVLLIDNYGSGGDHRLKSTSAGYHNATDGTDVGVNVPAFNFVRRGAETGDWTAAARITITGGVRLSGGVRFNCSTPPC